MKFASRIFRRYQTADNYEKFIFLVELAGCGRARRAIPVHQTDSATLAAMIPRIPVSYTRRRLLKTIPAALGSAFVPKSWGALGGPGPIKPQAAFSRFVDVAASAGLTQTMFYGESAGATYVTEIMGGGCAFFDYDNDGWLDIFILGGRR